MVVRQDGGGVPDQLLRPGGPEQLHRADVVAPPSRVGRGAGVFLHQHVADAETAQEEGGGQAHQGAAHDEDRYAVVDVLVHQLLQLGRGTDAVSMPSGRSLGGTSADASPERCINLAPLVPASTISRGSDARHAGADFMPAGRDLRRFHRNRRMTRGHGTWPPHRLEGERKMTTLSERISQSAFDGSRLRVVLLLDLHDGAQQPVPRGVRAPAQPGGLGPRTHQRPAVPVHREPLAVAHHQRVGERPALPRLGEQRGARGHGAAAAQLRPRHPLAALQRAARDRGRLRGHSRAGQAPPPGRARDSATASSGTRSPSPSSRAARRWSRRSSPTTPRPQPGSTTPPGCAAPRCSCTATGWCGPSRCAGDLLAALRHVARQPEVRAVEEAINPYLEQDRDLGDPDSARVFFTRAALPAVHHVAAGAARPPRVQRHALFYPAKAGCGMAAGPAPGPQDEAAADDPASPVAAQHRLPARRHRGAAVDVTRRRSTPSPAGTRHRRPPQGGRARPAARRRGERHADERPGGRALPRAGRDGPDHRPPGPRRPDASPAAGPPRAAVDTAQRAWRRTAMTNHRPRIVDLARPAQPPARRRPARHAHPQRGGRHQRLHGRWPSCSPATASASTTTRTPRSSCTSSAGTSRWTWTARRTRCAPTRVC